MSLYITPTAREHVIHDGLVTFPDECCGFLYGRESGDERTITEILPVDNSKEGNKRRRFEIKPQDYIKAERYTETSGLQLLGIYHSHPDHPSVPSEHDRVAAQPFFSYVIVSIYAAEFNTIQSWRLNDESQFEEELISQHQFSNQ